MQSLKIIPLLVLAVLAATPSRTQVPADTVLFARDSALDIPTDPTTIFFREGEKSKSPGKILLMLKDGKTRSLSALMKRFAPDENTPSLYADHVFCDMDNDGKKELLISNFTGGAHCCDEIYVFTYMAPGKYRQTVKLFAGNTIITKEKEFIYDFHEQFGYFFTCFACGYEDSTDVAPQHISTILLRYHKGKMKVQPGDPELKTLILDNLDKLGEQPYQPLEEDIAQDNGLRKEIALNLVVYYYSFGKNLAGTLQLFYKYYRHPDVKTTWAAFVKQLQYLQQENDF
ncbi:MAG: hypothetical protein HYZ15_11430 [Sphingobacteriales bacterium]|nr:hypothetical protein [Sphingobacteriales bacterium]